MANIKSAKKRVLVNQTKAARNKSRNSAMKTAIKKAHVAAETNAADKEAVVRAAIKKVDNVVLIVLRLDASVYAEAIRSARPTGWLHHP